MSQSSANVKPAVGVAIPQSRLKILAVIPFLLAMLSGGIGIAWAWWTESELPLPAVSVRISTSGGLAGLLAAVLAGFIIPGMIFLFFAGEKLIIARDRLQIVHQSRGGDRVDVQFPYRNIARIFIGDDEGVKFIGILLQNPADPDTFAVGWDFQTTDASDGWHYQIPDGYQRGLDEIHQMILDRLRAPEDLNINP